MNAHVAKSGCVVLFILRTEWRIVGGPLRVFKNSTTCCAESAQSVLFLAFATWCGPRILAKTHIKKFDEINYFDEKRI